ncbi:4-hydroxythreonine-4-phosphate dehydrogenase PdxA [Kamptonema cortianum]|nr:4-hydroxythreonine-4-phosphate dehydrogenase PdxA [Oscillatoria laete-virens]MDK3159610.1 4-hydroxythreonine-4-phosphate dehydrogenase PdxA [Kamptonema cortianum]MDL5055094.1 4-hydroxythreonine-4-phosphate dehydrogenase PdxA [Oscillatoria laete-virens NRMC-F 0139]
MNAKPVIGITLGDVAGIGPEIVEKALASGKLDQRFLYRVILHESRPAQIAPGRISKVAAQFALESLEEGVRLARAGQIAALVTAPVNKTALKKVGFKFPGQTEFLAARCGTKKFAMMLCSDKLRVALVTTHVPVKDVSKLLRAEKIARVTELTAQFVRFLGLKTPRIGVLGLNPHAGEIGTEEKRIIAPAIARARKLRGCEGSVISGPLSADTAFYYALRGDYDAVVCMYHDQGLIPLKMLSFDTGVNVTLGLPIVRTSPDHGTAFDIAGRGVASPESMIAAMNLAAELAARKSLKHK